MSNDWPAVCLNDFVSIKHGFAFKGEFFSDTPTKDVLVTPGNFAVGGGFKSDKLKYYNGPVPEDYILNPDDLLVTMTDLSKQADTLGFSALVPSHSSNQYLHNQRIGLVTFKNLELDKFYLFFLLRSQEYRHHVISSATGSTVKHTSPSRITSFELRLPPLPVQEKVGRVLKYFEDKIQLNNQISQTLEQMAQAIFKSWFVDFEPTKAKIAVLDAGGTEDEALLAAMTAISGKNNAELEQFKSVSSEQYEKLRSTAELFPSEMQDSELGEIPEGWEVQIIGEAVTAVGGGTPSTKNPEFWGGGNINWTTPKDLSSLQDKVLTETSRKVTEQGLAKISSRLLPVDTVLMSSRAPVGYLALAKIPVAINQGYIAMKCDKVLTPEYVLQWCSASMEEIKGRAGGTTFAEISRTSFREIPVIVPSQGVITNYSNTVKNIYELITKNVLQSKTLAEVRDTLLPRLLSGEIDVSTVAK